MSACRRRSLIVVFSDFVDPTTAELMIENVAMLNRQHLIVFATLRDPLLRALAETPPETSATSPAPCRRRRC